MLRSFQIQPQLAGGSTCSLHCRWGAGFTWWPPSPQWERGEGSGQPPHAALCRAEGQHAGHVRGVDRRRSTTRERAVVGSGSAWLWMKPIRVSAVGASAAPRGGVGPWVRGAWSPYMLSYVARPMRRALAPPGWWGALWDAHEHCASGGGLGGVGGPYTGEGAGHWGERCPPDSWLWSPQPCTLLGFDASPGSSTSEGVWRRGRRSVQRGGGLTDGRARLSGCLGLQRAAAGRARARGG